MTFLRSMYAVPEERWLYRVRSNELQLPDDTYEWLYFYAESGKAAGLLLDTIIELHGEVIDIATAQVFDEIDDFWFDLRWLDTYERYSELTDEDDTSMLF